MTGPWLAGWLGNRGSPRPLLSIGGDGGSDSDRTLMLPRSPHWRPAGGHRVGSQRDGVLTAPGGALHHLNPRLAEICALVRQAQRLDFYVLEGQQGSPEISAFVAAAAIEVGQMIPPPRLVDQQRLRTINIGQAEAQLAGRRGTESRARLNA